jgi:hypothetical protein
MSLPKRVPRSGWSFGAEPISGRLRLANGKLDLDRVLGRADHARKLDENAVAGGVDDASSVLAHQRQDRGLISLRAREGGDFVRAPMRRL